jgi:hypothetical protein
MGFSLQLAVISKRLELKTSDLAHFLDLFKLFSDLTIFFKNISAELPQQRNKTVNL